MWKRRYGFDDETDHDVVQINGVRLPILGYRAHLRLCMSP